MSQLKHHYKHVLNRAELKKKKNPKNFLSYAPPEKDGHFAAFSLNTRHLLNFLAANTIFPLPHDNALNDVRSGCKMAANRDFFQVTYLLSICSD